MEFNNILFLISLMISDISINLCTAPRNLEKHKTNISSYHRDEKSPEFTESFKSPGTPKLSKPQKLSKPPESPNCSKLSKLKVDTEASTSSSIPHTQKNINLTTPKKQKKMRFVQDLMIKAKLQELEKKKKPVVQYLPEKNTRDYQHSVPYESNANPYLQEHYISQPEHHLNYYNQRNEPVEYSQVSSSSHYPFMTDDVYRPEILHKVDDYEEPEMARSSIQEPNVMVRHPFGEKFTPGNFGGGFLHDAIVTHHPDSEYRPRPEH